MPNEIAEQENLTVTINNKVYKSEDLSDKAKAIINDIQIIQNKINDKSIEIDIFNLSKDTLMNVLVQETSELTPIEVLEQPKA